MAQSFLRRLRRGAPVIVVSGLPRSGTSMAMRMLQAGGVPILTDGLRQPDACNPNGYYELERVKELDKGHDAGWLGEARGQALKIISFLLTYLPETYDYQVIFMRRDLDEIVAYTAVPNAPSRRVMEKLGMSHDAEGDFNHPAVPENHPLQRHVLYRLSRGAFAASGRV